ncbi:MAG: DUF131 domain-containing protein [Candidatus Methanofastidiosa archaeon]|jgi:uncharacterized protein (TIGR00304 family)|nr:DUF131 domain-containing protein [Candidatus Methanofastidiosa archaeon]
MDFERLVLLGFLIVFIGIILIFVGTIFSSFRGNSEGNLETGGVILIGPIPIMFGNSRPLILFSIVGAIILMTMYFLFYGGNAI